MNGPVVTTPAPSFVNKAAVSELIITPAVSKLIITSAQLIGDRYSKLARGSGKFLDKAEAS
jgi:hypothetical protein